MSVYGSLVQPDTLCAHTFHKDSVSDFILLLIIATWQSTDFLILSKEAL